MVISQWPPCDFTGLSVKHPWVLDQSPQAGALGLTRGKLAGLYMFAKVFQSMCQALNNLRVTQHVLLKGELIFGKGQLSLRTKGEEKGGERSGLPAQFGYFAVRPPLLASF